MVFRHAGMDVSRSLEEPSQAGPRDTACGDKYG